MDKISTLLTLYEGYPPVTGGFPSQRDSNVGLCCFFDVCQIVGISNLLESGRFAR